MTTVPANRSPSRLPRRLNSEATRAGAPNRTQISTTDARARTNACRKRTGPPSSATTRTSRRCLVSITLTVPPTSVITAWPLGLRASNSSSTRGRPWVMSSPATPPVWNVRIVSCVPGSPMDWAAMMPTASPTSTSRPVARFRP